MASAYSRRLARTSSSISKAAKFAINYMYERYSRLSSAMLTGIGDGLLGVSFDGCGLITGGVDELVVEDLHARIIRRQQGDLIGNGLRVRESRHILADAGEAQHDVLAVRSGQLCLRLFPNHHDVRVRLGE